MTFEPEPDDRLDDRTLQSLLEALDDEYRAHATYQQVLTDFGADVLPFANIVEAEARHIDALTRIFHRYGIEVPPNPWPGRVTRFPSIADACRAGVDAEIANGALYDRLLASTDRPDVIGVYRRLQQASQEHHLPAFRRGAERGGDDDGSGDGGHRRRRWRGGRG